MRRLVLLLALAFPASAHAVGDGRLEGSFTMRGRITVAENVRGERRGRRIVRTWRIHSSCALGPCRTVRLRRSRARGADVLTLARRSPGVYSGGGSFTVALRCGRRIYRRGGLVPFTITLRVTASTSVQSTRFATAVSATYSNPRRVNRTPCPGTIGRDGARYSGSRSGALPTPPLPSFTAVTLAPATLAFQDTSRPGVGGSPVVAESWDFGDPASGAANAASGPRPSHTFSSPGAFAVTLTVRDANGLTAAVTHALSAG